eukprot:SAG31_NODE_9127_length_1329_cov_1.586179_2_plen_196_part_00
MALGPCCAFLHVDINFCIVVLYCCFVLLFCIVVLYCCFVLLFCIVVLYCCFVLLLALPPFETTADGPLDAKQRSTVPFIYSGYYCLKTAVTGLLIAVPTGCGIGSSMVAVCVAKSADTGRLLRYGMILGCSAPYALAMGAVYFKLGWWTTTASVAVMSVRIRMQNQDRQSHGLKFGSTAVGHWFLRAAGYAGVDP